MNLYKVPGAGPSREWNSMCSELHRVFCFDGGGTNTGPEQVGSRLNLWDRQNWHSPGRVTRYTFSMRRVFNRSQNFNLKED